MLINRKGFTLVEVLIVVLIIAILTGVTLGLLNSGGYRQKARDSQRVSDLRKIQTALELYYQDNRVYPASSGSWTLASAISGLAPNYISSLPTDPSNAGYVNSITCPDYTSTNYYYVYRTNAANSRYVLTARMETNTVNSSTCGSLSNWPSAQGIVNASCTPAAASCYGVQNP